MKRILATGLTVFVSATVGASAAGAGTSLDFRRITNIDSQLVITRRSDLDGAVMNQSVYRAGSGVNQNACDSGSDGIGGWLPGGWYTLWGHWHDFNGTIKGRVWRLQDKRCGVYPYTLRTELFIHSEETAAQGQLCEPWCWDGDGDYYSLGCIKISRAAPYPSDLAKLHSNWDNWSGQHGSFTLYNRLYVS